MQQLRRWCLSVAARTAFALALAALLSGFGGWVFLSGLEWVTNLRLADGRWFWLAPLAGALTGLVFSRLDPSAAHGSVLLVSLGRHPGQEGALARVPRALAPLIVMFTWLSHLVGMSVGREGTAIQLGGGLAALSGRLAGVADGKSARLILLAGMAGGFGAVFHVPWAAAVFALEIAHARFVFGERRGCEKQQSARLAAGPAALTFAVCLASAFAADTIAGALGARHASFERYELRAIASPIGAFALIVSAAAFGLIAWVFLYSLHEFKKRWSALIKADWLRPAIGGFVFAPMALAPAVFLRYAGLGGYEIAQALRSAPSIWDWAGKLLMTVFSLGVGFKGGEVTPLFFMGASSGAALAQVFGLEPAALGSLGLVAVFGAAADLPVTCAVMAGELFGSSALVVALPVCLAANWICRHSRLYDSKPEL